MKPLSAVKPKEILLIEDSAADVRLTREALKEGNVSHHLNVASDGEAAMAFLHRRGPTSPPPAPTWCCST